MHNAAINPEYAGVVNRAFAIIDSRVIVASLRLRKLRGYVQLRGSDLMDDLISAGLEEYLSHAFVGGSPEVIGRLEDWFRVAHPDAIGEAFYSPSFLPVGEELVESCVKGVPLDAVDIIWLGLGSPKQDWVAEKIAVRTGKVVIGVGAAFDFKAGNRKEAPKFLRLVGLEWAYRLVKEPRRLWRRYMTGNATLLRLLIRGDGVSQ
ncbi:WecB/TagA/CpsF family glycosyltransferase [Demequina sp. NBRC 110055]|uniref:WecB/TagA/CpsF family glycosyltransferase n=1 Tax=Demequina sp. NBRC 110055 TaxID=1570344 RepID=UPI0013565928|nr:WecB/TagA/CpsF family glycosyltransferase [Demequina sp. NBRC 110055]